MALFDFHHPLIFTFGLLGNIVSIFVYFAPLPTFIQICKKKSTLEFQSVPYIVSLFSAMLWMYYALIKTNAVLLISINSFGCVMETIYLTIFLAYATKNARKQTMKLIASLNVGLFGTILLLTFFLVQGPQRVVVVGWISVTISVMVFAAPLSIVFKVVRTRSVEFMPFPLSLCLTLSAVMWFGYGILQKDLYVAMPNVFGFVLGLLQMLLYGVYKNAETQQVIDIEKPQQLSEQKVNIVKLGGPDQVHPVDPKTVTTDEKEAVEDDEKGQEQAEEEEEVYDERSVTALPDEPPLCKPRVEHETPVLVVCAA